MFGRVCVWMSVCACTGWDRRAQMRQKLGQERESGRIYRNGHELFKDISFKCITMWRKSAKMTTAICVCACAHARDHCHFLGETLWERASMHFVEHNLLSARAIIIIEKKKRSLAIRALYRYLWNFKKIGRAALAQNKQVNPLLRLFRQVF